MSGLCLHFSGNFGNSIKVIWIFPGGMPLVLFSIYVIPWVIFSFDWWLLKLKLNLYSRLLSFFFFFKLLSRIFFLSLDGNASYFKSCSPLDNRSFMITLGHKIHFNSEFRIFIQIYVWRCHYSTALPLHPNRLGTSAPPYHIELATSYVTVVQCQSLEIGISVIHSLFIFHQFYIHSYVCVVPWNVITCIDSYNHLYDQDSISFSY